MTIDIFWLHALVLSVVIVVAYLLQLRNVRLRARFDLYRVRDRFVLLVADDILDETSMVFTYFYKRVNRLLADDKPLGLDGVLFVLFKNRKNGDFERALANTFREAEKIAAAPDAQSEAVRAVIADFYTAVRGIIISHSSILRLIYRLSQFAVGIAIEKVLLRIAPEQIQRGIAAIDYTEKEAHQFAMAS